MLGPSLKNHSFSVFVPYFYTLIIEPLAMGTKLREKKYVSYKHLTFIFIFISYWLTFKLLNGLS